MVALDQIPMGQVDFRLGGEGGNLTRGGHPDVLKWAHANGCPWDREYCAGMIAENIEEMNVARNTPSFCLSTTTVGNSEGSARWHACRRRIGIPDKKRYTTG